MSQTVIGKWDGSLAVRVPGHIAEAVGLDDGQKVEILAESNAVVIRKLAPETTVEAMFDGRSPEIWRDLYADAYDWGPPDLRQSHSAQSHSAQSHSAAVERAGVRALTASMSR